MAQCTEPPREDGCRYAESAADSAVKKMFAIIGALFVALGVAAWAGIKKSLGGP